MPITASNIDSTSTPTAAPSKAALWIGRVLSGLTILFLLFDAWGKFAKPAPVTEAFTRLGLPIAHSTTIGVVLLLCTILYAIPRTAVLGAVLVTGFLGGAVAIQMRAGSPTFETIFPVIFGVIAWLGVYLRCRALRAVLPLC
jgi:hypothetical protein